MYAYRDAAVRRMAGLQPVRTTAGGFDLGAATTMLSLKARRAALGLTTPSPVQEAQRRDIPVMCLDDHSLVQRGQGIHQHRHALQHRRGRAGPGPFDP